MARGKWWPGDMPSQRAKVVNFKAKIGLYQDDLNWSPAQTTAAQTLCDAYIHAYDFAEACEATAEAVTAWRNSVFRGQPKGGAIDDPPVFIVGTPNPGTLGVVDQFFDLREEIVANPGFTEAMGEDLGILGPEQDAPLAENVTPDITVTVKNAYRVDISGSMQKQPQLRIEWKPKGSDTWTLLTFVSKLPAEITITPPVPGEAISVHIRAVFYRNNAEYGNFSPEYPVTLYP